FQRFALCQIGLADLHVNGIDASLYGARPFPDWFLSTIGDDSFEYEDEAIAVHGITPEQIRAAPRPAEVDALAVKWMEEHGIRKAIPMGYSVGSFDMPYFRETLPELSRRLSMRNLDLN